MMHLKWFIFTYHILINICCRLTVWGRGADLFGLLKRGNAKLRKVTISFIISVCLSPWNNSTPTGQLFMKFDFIIFLKFVEKIQVWLKSDRNKGYFT